MYKIKLLILGVISILIIGCEPVATTTTNHTDAKQLSLVKYGDHPLQNMDIYLPENRDENTKVVIMIHGGGWVIGYKPDGIITTFSGRYNWDILNPLIEKGYACVTMKYRTACYNTVAENFTESNTFYQDQMMEDIDLVIEHLKANATIYKIGENHFQLIGESAGGHIALAYANRENADINLKSVISMFGPTSLDDLEWKQLLAKIPAILATSPNYFLKSSENCTSVTGQFLKTIAELKSFSSTPNLSLTEENPSLFPLCPNRQENINNNTPRFITHGTEDLLVPFNHATSMYDALIKKYNFETCLEDEYSCNLKMKLYEKCGHGWTNANCNREKIVADIVSWVEQH